MKIKRKDIVKAFLFWIPFAITITAFCALTYGAVQQNFRQSANDPQIQIAEDLSTILEKGQDPLAIAPQANTDISKSLAVYVIIFDNKGKPLASTAFLDNQTPTPPAGVFDYAKKNGINKFTWEPKLGVRSAVVLIPYNGKKPGFIMAGRSLREVEKREKNLDEQVLFVWILSLGLTFLAVLFYNLKNNKK